MKNMKQVAEVLNKVASVGSTKMKQSLLKEADGHEYSDTLRRVLYYTYNPYLMYGLSVKALDLSKEPGKMTFSVASESDVFELLDTLARSNINDSLRATSKRLLMSIQDDEVRDMVKGMMCKDLKLGINVASLNKIFDKGFIPTFNVQLAESYSKQKPEELDGKEIWVTTKMDGFRIVYNPELKQFFTRKGQLYEGLEHLIDECDALSEDLRNISGIDELVMLDGELVHEYIDGKSSQELYSLTSSIARKKGHHKDKVKLKFHVFDFVPVNEFNVGSTTLKYKARRKALNLSGVLACAKHLQRVETLYNGPYNEGVIVSLLNDVEEQGLEGLMINLDGVYECRRTKKLLKVKTFNTADVLVTGVYEGEKGKEFEGTLGGVNIQFLYNGEARTCNCGSGFDKEERDMFFKNPELIIGKVIEINYFEVTKDSKTGTESLRFGTYQHRIREDKTAEDITDVAL